MGNGQVILNALDAFIKKHYKNIAIRGALVAVGIVVAIYLVAVALEYVGWLPRVWRGVLFWVAVVVMLVAVVWLVARPLAKMQGLTRRRMSREEAAVEVGRLFPEVNDKMLNLLQLMKEGEVSDDGGLLAAAIEQKTAAMRPIPILSGIDLKANKRYLKYALPPVAILLLVLLVAPSAVTKPTQRIVNYNTVYAKPMPFRFVIGNDEMSVGRGDDFELVVTTEGEVEPKDVYVVVDERRYHMMRKADGVFGYTFVKPYADVQFGLEGGGVSETGFVLKVIPNPAVVAFRLLLSYPAYTGRQSETLLNIGDASVPEGSVLKWMLQTQHADSVVFLYDGERIGIEVDGNGRAEFAKRVTRGCEYGFYVVGRQESRVRLSDTLSYRLVAIVDEPPAIAVEEMIDSTRPEKRIFRGRIKDDYGFSKLVFKHELSNVSDSTRKTATEVEIGLGGELSQEFFFTFNMGELPMQPGDELGYWFEVSDNDGIHGPKTTRSRQFELKIPTAEEMDRMIEQGNEEIRNSAENQMDALQSLQEEIAEMMRKLVDKKELTWQDKKDLEQIRQKQAEVKDMMQQMMSQIEENNRVEQKYREQSEQLMEKQRELDRLMNEVMDEKMKQTMAEIEKMMQEVDKKKVQQELEQLRLDNADLEKQLDQNIELMKRLEIEKRVEQAVQKAEKLAEEQRELAQKTEQAKGKDNEEMKQKQQQLDEKYKQLESEIEKIKQEYKELDPSSDFKVPYDLMEQIESEQQQATESMQKGKNKEASKQQKQAADDLDKLSEAIAEAQMEMEQDDLAEDADMIRMLLKNLVRLSFNQEALIDDLNHTYIQDPKYQDILVAQNRVKDDFRSVEDSLNALAKRQLQVASMVTKEVAAVNSNISRSLKGLLDMNQSFYGNSKNTGAARSMQYSMTSLNNLSLVLAESLDKMQNQMRQNSQRQKSGQCKNSSKSNQQCNNPGKKPSPKSMRQMQQELNKQMEALKKQLDKQGKNKSQRHQMGQQSTMSEELVKMAAQQEMIRHMMQEYGQEMKQQNAGNGKLAREIDQMMKQMEQTETDLVNRTITQQTIKRQQQIMTRLLEHEKAEMQREKEQRRESKDVGEQLYGQPSPEELAPYMRDKKSPEEQLRSVPPSFSPYYKKKAADYFYRGE